jgi:hypothetical protein
MLRSIVALSALLAASAQAGPITALACVNPKTGTSVTVGISTDLFAPSAPARILAYDLTVGKLGPNGEVVSEKSFHRQSNMKTFEDDAQAYTWVEKNTVVIPMTEGEDTSGAVLVDAANSKVTLIDTDYETTETFVDCDQN